MLFVDHVHMRQASHSKNNVYMHHVNVHLLALSVATG